MLHVPKALFAIITPVLVHLGDDQNLDDQRRTTARAMETAALRTLQAIQAGTDLRGKEVEFGPYTSSTNADAWGYPIEVELVLVVESSGADGRFDDDAAADNRVQRTLIRGSDGHWQAWSAEAALAFDRELKEPKLESKLFVFGDPYKRSKTRQALQDLSASVVTRTANSSVCPALESFEGKDGWGNPMRVRVEAAVRSTGSDGMRGGTGDAADLNALFSYVAGSGQGAERTLVPIIEPSVLRAMSGRISINAANPRFRRWVVVQNECVLKAGGFDDAGRYAAKGLPVGEFWLCIASPGERERYGMMPVARCRVIDGEWVVKNFAVSAGSISGRVVDQSGSTRANCDIMLRWIEGPMTGFATLLRSDSSGVFEFNPATTGTVAIGSADSGDCTVATIRAGQSIDVGTTVIVSSVPLKK